MSKPVWRSSYHATLDTVYRIFYGAFLKLESSSPNNCINCKQVHYGSKVWGQLFCCCCCWRRNEYLYTAGTQKKESHIGTEQCEAVNNDRTFNASNIYLWCQMCQEISHVTWEVFWRGLIAVPALHFVGVQILISALLETNHTQLDA